MSIRQRLGKAGAYGGIVGLPCGLEGGMELEALAGSCFLKGLWVWN